jgi:hypothetical protein
MLRRVLPVTLVIGLTLGALASTAAVSAAPGGKGGGGSSSMTLVLIDSPDLVPNYGERITFAVSTTATSTPLASLFCYQGTTLVYQSYAGFWDTYPYNKDFTLRSGAWTGGAADCHARLYYSRDGRRTITLATLDFRVEA